MIYNNDKPLFKYFTIYEYIVYYHIYEYSQLMNCVDPNYESIFEPNDVIFILKSKT